MKLARLLIPVVVLLLSYTTSAQVGCIDSAQRNTLSCNSRMPIRPVCGCNNETYINECYALNDGVIDYTQGVCSEVEIVAVRPNPVQDDFLMELCSRRSARITVYIQDLYGKIYYFGRFSTSDFERCIRTTIRTTDFEVGMYVIYAYANNEVSVQRFVKI